ncbi:MAG TPA: MEDS domain-containing protein [Acidimicrobiales bacterium]|nr:MEDS domain-containing protein [Acidimicrobiales bacterium]
MTSGTRTTGAVADIGALAPGEHVCWAVDTDDDYHRLATSCMAAGTNDGDKVFYFGPEATLAASPGPAAATAALDPAVTVLGGGALVPSVMLEMFHREAASAAKEGYRALRVVADMDWVARRVTPEELTAFELNLDAVVHQLGAVVICAYRTTTYSAEEVAQVNTVHPQEFGRPPDNLGFRVWSGGPQCWDVAGEVDCFNADAFGFALASAAASGPVRVRLTGLAFIDVAGMRAIATAAASVPTVRIQLEGPSETFVRCWTLLGYDALAPVVEVVR